MTDNACPIESLADSPPSSVRKRDRARFLTQEIKATVQDLLHPDSDRPSSSHDDIFQDAAFDPQGALRHEDKTRSSIGDRLTLGAKTVVNTIKNPKAVGRNNYTRHAVAKFANHPHFQSTALDHELLDAHDALTRAQMNNEASDQDRAPPPMTSDHVVDIVDAQSRVQRVQEQRDNLKSGWILGRHVVRAKAVRPIAFKPEREQFLSPPVAPGKPPRLQIGPYLGHLALWYTAPFTASRIDDYDQPPFDLVELSLTFERLAAVSVPWQMFAGKVRQIYRWENPTLTLQIMLTYCSLWYFRRLVSFSVAYIIYLTLKNKIYPTKVQAIRERVQRSQDQSAIVREWGELILKHGGSDWVEPLLDGLGPHFQLQLSDLTIFLERLQNFYHWAQPSSTWSTLSIYLAGLIFLLFAPAQLCVDIFWMVMGFCFFLATPIATNYPKYRHVVSPLCWLYWTVPDAAELAIRQLRQKVATRDETRVQALHDEKTGTVPQKIQSSNTTSGLSLFEFRSRTENLSVQKTDLLHQVRASDQLTFETSLLPTHSAGHVILSRTHITFDMKNRDNFSYPYTAIVEIFKVDLNRGSNNTAGADSKNKLSRMTHMSRSIEKNEDIQILPDGLGFVFLQDDSVDTDSGFLKTTSNPNHHTATQNPPQLYATTTDTKPALDPRTIPHSEDLETGPTPPTDINQGQKKAVTLVLNKSDRDKIFAVVLAWSNMDWQPLYSLNRQNKLGTRQMGAGKKQPADGCKATNVNLDEAIKRALV